MKRKKLTIAILTASLPVTVLSTLHLLSRGFHSRSHFYIVQVLGTGLEKLRNLLRVTQLVNCGPQTQTQLPGSGTYIMSCYSTCTGFVFAFVFSHFYSTLRDVRDDVPSWPSLMGMLVFANKWLLEIPNCSAVAIAHCSNGLRYNVCGHVLSPEG